MSAAGSARRAAPSRGAPDTDAAAPARDYRIEALSKGLRVLSLFSEQRPCLRLSDIASETGMLLPTVYRIAMTLESDGFLSQLPDGRYRPGVKVLGLGYSALAGLDVVQAATGPLQALAEQTGETVNLAVLSEDKVVYVVRLRNSDLVTANIQVGSRLPAVHSSIGKVLLAHLDQADLTARLSPASFSKTAGPNALHTLAALQPQLREIRSQGFALQDEELAYGLRSIAAPVWAAGGRVVAGANIAVNAMEWDVARIMSDLKPALLATTTEVSTLLGTRS